MVGLYYSANILAGRASARYVLPSCTPPWRIRLKARVDLGNVFHHSFVNPSHSIPHRNEDGFSHENNNNINTA